MLMYVSFEPFVMAQQYVVIDDINSNTIVEKGTLKSIDDYDMFFAITEKYEIQNIKIKGNKLFLINIRMNLKRNRFLNMV